MMGRGNMIGACLALVLGLVLQGCGSGGSPTPAPTPATTKPPTPMPTPAPSPCPAQDAAQSCGGAADHMKNLCVQISPDPLQEGQPFTISVSGDLDEEIDAGSLHTDLEITAVDGLVKSTMKQVSPFTLSPALVKGPQKLVVGPLTFPSPAEITGKIFSLNAKNESVNCIALKLKIPETTMSNAAALQAATDQARTTKDPVVTSCTQDSDHLKKHDIKTEGGVTTILGNLDERVTNTTIKIDMVVQKLILKVPVQMNIPISYLPGIPQGDLKVTVGPTTGGEPHPDSPTMGFTIKGTVKANDGKGEEVACMNIEQDVGAAEQLSDVMV